ncbi:MAG: divalent metal cation transporter [Planctomycetales bacterium]|nr:divalent metal cation transporter [Planctomycetales bacterium]
MSEHSAEQQRERILKARQAGRGATLVEYLKLSGPGWLQSAITLGGGSLAGSLYLGIIGGYEMMWLQPLMMIFGVVMLSAIAHVTLCSHEKPFQSLNRCVSPLLGWGWLVASLMANLVWAMPQFSLGTAALRQNLGLLTFDGGEYAATLLLLAVSSMIVWLYDKGGKGYRAFDILLKLMVGLVVVCFFMVVYTMSTSAEGLPWSQILQGFIPNPSLIFEPTESLRGLIDQSSAPAYWRETIVSAQRDRMVAAAATAVGINMTFLLPYSMLKRGWDKEFSGLVRFDLSTGLFIPFLLATSCVVIAAATQFHGKPEPGLIEYHQQAAAADTELSPKLIAEFEGNLTGMLNASGSKAEFADLPAADRVLAATLIQRDAFELANSLEKFTGKGIAQRVFGVGVIGMAVSSIVILMLINGFAVCEAVDRPSTGWFYQFGCLLPGLTGALGALFLWSGKAKFYLAVPTSRFGMVLLPIAYIAFLFLMNNRELLGNAMPRGASRVLWNVLMTIAVALALVGAAISILNDTAQIPGTTIYVRHLALALVSAFLVAGVIFHLRRKNVH